MASPPFPPESAAAFLDQVLEPLLEDFAASFERGFVLLERCPESVLPLARQLALLGRLEEARRELTAARALRAAAPVPMALEMATITPWHELVVEVWSLSAALRRAA
jgi:predicted ATPase